MHQNFLSKFCLRRKIYPRKFVMNWKLNVLLKILPDYHFNSGNSFVNSGETPFAPFNCILIWTLNSFYDDILKYNEVITEYVA